MNLNPYRPFARYLRPYRRAVAAGLVLLAGVQAITMALPMILKWAIDTARLGLDGTTPLSVVRLHVALYAGAIAGLAVLQWGMNSGMRWYFTSVSRFVERDLRQSYVNHLLRLPLGFFQQWPVGDLMARATNDVEAIQRFLHHAFRMTLMGILTFVLSLALMWVIDWQLALYSLLPMPVMALTTSWVSGKVRRGYRRVQEQFAAMSAHIQESLAGIRVVKAYAREANQIEAFSRLNQEYVDHNHWVVNIRSLFFPFTFLLNGVSLVVILWLGGLRVIDGALTLGSFVAFNAYLIRMGRPMMMLGRMMTEYQRAVASLRRIEAMLGEPVQPLGEATQERPIRGEIEFRQLGFAYDGQPVLDDIALRVPAGGALAVVGRVGSGKSTLARLLPRLIEAGPGQVLIDGVPVDEIPLSVLRDAIGYVPQDTFLFSDTIRENIALGRGDGGREDVDWAAEVAQLTGDLNDFPEQLDTVVGERGVTLSGGQKQRTALARAVIRQPRILILDDAMASVDTRTEEEILRRLRGVMASRTTILIAHRISTVKDADCIVVLEGGRIVETGTHDELVARNGIYAGMYQRQHLADELTVL